MDRENSVGNAMANSHPAVTSARLHHYPGLASVRRKRRRQPKDPFRALVKTSLARRPPDRFACLTQCARARLASIQITNAGMDFAPHSDDVTFRSLTEDGEG